VSRTELVVADADVEVSACSVVVETSLVSRNGAEEVVVACSVVVVACSVVVETSSVS